MKKYGGAVRLLAGFVVVALLAGAYGVIKKAGEAAKAAGRDTLVALTADQITGLAFTLSDGTSYDFTRAAGQWAWTKDAALPVSQTALNSLAAGVTGIGIYQTLEAVTDLAQYGLKEPAVIFTVTDKEGNRITAAVGDANETAGSVYAYLLEDPTTVYSVLVSLKTNFEVTEETLTGDVSP